jgi:Ca2+-binding RTX toxin-like protein
MNSYTGGGAIDASGSSQPMILVGNNDGLKTGTTDITSGTGNDSILAGASDNIRNTGGTDDINLKNTRDGGASIDMLTQPDRRAYNNIRNYNPLLNFFRKTAEAVFGATWRFLNGEPVGRYGNVTNTFKSSGSRDLADLASADNDVFAETNATVTVDTTDAKTTVQLTNSDQVVINATGYTGDAVLIGNENDNVIYGGSGNNSLWGGESGDDTLFGGDGVNEFFYLKGNGDDVISGAKDGDVVKLLDISVDDIKAKYTSIDDDKVVIAMEDGGALTVDGKADVTFELKDGSKWTANRKNKGFDRK